MWYHIMQNKSKPGWLQQPCKNSLAQDFSLPLEFGEKRLSIMRKLPSTSVSNQARYADYPNTSPKRRNLNGKSIGKIPAIRLKKIHPLAKICVISCCFFTQLFRNSTLIQHDIGGWKNVPDLALVFFKQSFLGEIWLIRFWVSWSLG